MTARLLEYYLNGNNSGTMDVTNEDMLSIMVDSTFREATRMEARKAITLNGPGLIQYSTGWMVAHWEPENGDMFSAFHNLRVKTDFAGCIEEREGNLVFDGRIKVEVMDYWGFSRIENGLRQPFDIPAPNWLPDRFEKMREYRFYDLEQRGWTKPFKVQGTRERGYMAIVSPGSNRVIVKRRDPYE